MKKIEKLCNQIDKNEFIDYYSTHTRANTAEHYNITEADVKILSKYFGFKKTRDLIGKQISQFYQENILVTLHLPGEFHFIKVAESLVNDYLQQGYILGYEQSEDTKINRVKHTKQTKLNRYGDSNYNNVNLGKQTKLEKYGDANYNNKEKIKQTQFEKYGGFAFNDWDKVHATNMERYGVEHNWSSADQKLNGRTTMYEMYGSKDLYYKHVREKGCETKLELYGDKFYSNHEKAQQTMLERYEVLNYTEARACRDKTTSPEVRAKCNETKRRNHTFHQSTPEIVVKKLLVEHFGEDDVKHSYQSSAYIDIDTNYQFQCDFYIKSLDLFIELNYHPTHGLHPFDFTNVDDQTKLDLLKSNSTQWNNTVIDVWTVRDVKKLQCAKENNLKYLMLYPNDDYNDIINIINNYISGTALSF